MFFALQPGLGNMISITLDNVSKRFGSAIALDKISLTIKPGELFFLLGPSGCGKTTLLRHIAGFYKPDEGSVKFDQEDVTALPPHKRNTGMVFQSYALWPHLTVAQNVAFGLEERRVPRPEIIRRVNEALDSVRMSAYSERRIAQLSGGQQQRVALARALVIRPRCLLLDEPLSNLDAKLRLEMRTEIRRVCKDFGLTAIYVTHDQKEALSIADRMAILDTGRTAQIGAPLEIYQSPRSRLVADFIGETNFISGIVLDLSPHGVRVGSDLGCFDARVTDSNWSPVKGEKVTLSIRPEAWRLFDKNTDSTESSAGNVVAGRIGDSVYLGEVAQHQFQPSAGGPQLKIFELNPRFIGVGGERDIFAVADPRDVVALRH